MSVNWNETPGETQRRVRQEQENAASERAARAAQAAQTAAERPREPLPKSLGEMDPVERQNHLAQLKADEEAERARHAEELRRGRARRAYLAATGSEEGFEGLYNSSIRQKMIEEETLRAMQPDDKGGGVRW